MLARTKSPPFALGAKVGSAELNAIDQNIENAADKRAGQSDTIGCVWTLAGAGRVIERFAAGPDADTTWLVSGANGVVRCGLTTAERTYTLGLTDAIAGDRVRFMLDKATAVFDFLIKDSLGALLYTLGLRTSRNAEGTFCEVVFDGTEWVLMHGDQSCSQKTEVITATGTWLCPEGVYEVWLTGYGGGSGGAGGYLFSNAITRWNSGGSGGCGSWEVVRRVAVVPGTTYNITIGAGGTGGILGAAISSYGGDGGDTIFGVGSAAETYFVGASGGSNGAFGTSTTDYWKAVPGVSYKDPAATGASLQATATDLLAFFADNGRPPGRGGAAYSHFNGSDGNRSLQNFAGGTGAAKGIDSGSYRGGGGGGGGGAGPGGAGANGGAGGVGNGAGNGGNAAAGGAAAANTGAGGGGGGAPGMGSSGTPGGGGGGGAAGSGKLTITWNK